MICWKEAHLEGMLITINTGLCGLLHVTIINLHCTCLSTAQFHRYFKTAREREMRKKGGKNEQHKEKCKKNRRLLTVSFDKYSITIQFV